MISALSCVFGHGDGIGGTERRIGDQTPEECIRSCTELKKTNPKINGVTIHANGGGGCWCELGMTGANNANSYKTCLLKEEEKVEIATTAKPEPGKTTTYYCFAYILLFLRIKQKNTTEERQWWQL